MTNRKKGTLKKLLTIETRFKQETGIDIDLSVYPLQEYSGAQQKTTKELSDKYGQIFTPLWLVDKMLEKHDNWKDDLTYHDMCCGFGQFSVRILRKKYKVLGENFDIDNFLKYRHLFTELQLNSAQKVIKIFGENIRLAIGDVTKIASLNATTGIWVLKNTWVRYNAYDYNV